MAHVEFYMKNGKIQVWADENIDILEAYIGF
jgi:hypothetical protein